MAAETGSRTAAAPENPKTEITNNPGTQGNPGIGPKLCAANGRSFRFLRNSYAAFLMSCWLFAPRAASSAEIVSASFSREWEVMRLPR